MDAELTIRPAQPGDRAAMERICAHTWDWGDYIPDVWEEWLADERGLVLVGALGEHVVALSKTTFQADHQVWLEGMRVAPEFRRRGIAERFLAHSLTLARARGARVVRLATGQRNATVQRLATRAGMRLVSRYVLWAAEPMPGGSAPMVLTPAHGAQVRSFLRDSPVLAHTQGLYGMDWAYQDLSDERVTQFLCTGGLAAQLSSDGTLAALAVIEMDADGEELWVGFADGRPVAVAGLAAAIRTYAAEVSVERIRVTLPDVAWLRAAFHTAGFGPVDFEGELWVYECWLTRDSGGKRDR